MVASLAAWRAWRKAEERFNPLHCGAVVASSGYGAACTVRRCFNPLHCGAVVASQWSRPLFPCPTGDRFNPLHCGAVVASCPFRNVDFPVLASFNPLHCGAVVASGNRGTTTLRLIAVSIPFIAGQWSLRRGVKPRSAPRRKFQSPSLRGSGRFVERPPPHGGGARRVSIPFIAGQWSLLTPPFGGVRGASGFQSPSLRGSGRFAAGGFPPW